MIALRLRLFFPALLGLAALSGCGCSGPGPTLGSNAPSLPSNTPTRSQPSPAAPAVSAVPPPEIKTPDGTFLVKPYLQLGDAAVAGEQMAVLWQTGDTEAAWTVEAKPATAPGGWKTAAPASARRIAVSGIAPHRVWSATVTGLSAGQAFDYRVLKGGTPVFAARARARKSAESASHRFVVFGDCAAGTRGQREIAFQTYQQKPDFVFLTGDIVYSHGRASEYREKYFPIYNADAASPKAGAPLLRSTLFLAAPGNHDIGYRNLDRYPDGLAYFLYWSQPLNGPLATVGADSTPAVSGSAARQKAFVSAAGSAYPRMANFSFDYGSAHWTVLDANSYVDWSDPTLRAWLEKDLAGAKNAVWRFVAFHQPGFNSSRSHFTYQKMRAIADLLEKGGVDIVFSGHVHNYQRTYPLRFAVKSAEGGPPGKGSGGVSGDWTLDKTFDGKTNTRPVGVLYIITGAGGASRYNPEQQDNPSSWQPFTHKYIADTYSLTVVDVDGKTLTVKQITGDGKERDRFTVTK